MEKKLLEYFCFSIIKHIAHLGDLYLNSQSNAPVDIFPTGYFSSTSIHPLLDIVKYPRYSDNDYIFINILILQQWQMHLLLFNSIRH
jgi:hypothetical protein